MQVRFLGVWVSIVTYKRTSCYASTSKLLQGCCQADIRMCLHCLFSVVVESLEQVVITLLQGWWLWQTCYKLSQQDYNTGYSQQFPAHLLQLVIIKLLTYNLLRADDIRLVGKLVGSLLAPSTLLEDNSNFLHTCRQLEQAARTHLVDKLIFTRVIKLLGNDCRCGVSSEQNISLV